MVNNSSSDELSDAKANIAFVGTGFVADYYMITTQNYPSIEISGVWDQDTKRLEQFSNFYDLRPYSDLNDLLADPDIDIVVNLTTPDSHFDINYAALAVGKHVYCEKPLAMTPDEAVELGNLAKKNNLSLCSAPANGLSDAFNEMLKLIQKNQIGAPKLIYVELEDGPVFRANWQEWKSKSGAPWPGQHEFEVGCTIEHAGYGLSWLLGLCGPVKHLTSFSTLLFHDKLLGGKNDALAPDFSVGCLTFENNVVARISCGLSAPRDRSFTVIGDTGTLTVRDLWDHQSDILLTSHGKRDVFEKVTDRVENKIGKVIPVNSHRGSKVKYPVDSELKLPDYPSQINFMGGVAAQAAAIAEGTLPFYSGDVAVHMTEITLALNAGQQNYTPISSFEFHGR